MRLRLLRCNSSYSSLFTFWSPSALFGRGGLIMSTFHRNPYFCIMNFIVKLLLWDSCTVTVIMISFISTSNLNYKTPILRYLLPLLFKFKWKNCMSLCFVLQISTETNFLSLLCPTYLCWLSGSFRPLSIFV